VPDKIINGNDEVEALCLPPQYSYSKSYDSFHSIISDIFQQVLWTRLEPSGCGCNSVLLLLYQNLLAQAFGFTTLQTSKLFCFTFIVFTHSEFPRILSSALRLTDNDQAGWCSGKFLDHGWPGRRAWRATVPEAT